MAIPTLRNLGLIIGYARDIRLSANGELLHQTRRRSLDEGMRTLRAILLEFDTQIGILSLLAAGPSIPLASVMDQWLSRITTSSSRKPASPRTRPAKERLTDWLRFLSFANLIFLDKDQAHIDQTQYDAAIRDADIRDGAKSVPFGATLFRVYDQIVREQGGVRTVEIDLLRARVATDLYKSISAILTEQQFDKLLAMMPLSTDHYTMTFGRSMGADEKLYVYRGRYFQTMSVRYSN